MRGKGLGTTVVPTGKTLASRTFLNTSLNIITPGYFDTMGMRLLEGRDLRFDDAAAKMPYPIVVDQAFARAFFPHQDVIGRTIVTGTDGRKTPNCRIVGLVTSAKYRSLREVPPPTFYEMLQSSAYNPGVMNFNVRTYGHPRSIIPEVRQALSEVDPHVPITAISTMESEVHNSLWQERLVLIMTGFFGVVALVLAAIGLYGALSQAVAQRTVEIGIRMALGARVHHIVTSVCVPLLWPVIFGSLAGLAAGAALLRLAKALLYGLSPIDPLSYALATGFVLAAALLAALLPSLRAVKVEPASALRGE
jgi:putative ABC transport system permease protein